MIIKKVDCINCNAQVEFDRKNYKSQEVKCLKCEKRMKIRPYKNGRITIRNLDA